MDPNGIGMMGGKPPVYGGMPSMSPSMIGNTPAYNMPTSNAARVNNVIIPIVNDEDYKKQLQRKGMYDPSSMPRQEDSRIAGVKYRPKTGERSISDVFNSQSDVPNKVESRHLQKHDISGIYQ
jgi:hypothetical protein